MNEIVLGSFFGDEGKGQTVHNLCKTHPREETIVIRFSGGHQVGHTVRHGKLEHTFSNYGSGTLLGIQRTGLVTVQQTYYYYERVG